MIFLVIGLFILSLQAQMGEAQENKNPSWTEQVEKVTGLKGAFNDKEGVFKVT